MNHDVLAPVQELASHPHLSSNVGITCMDILFEPSAEAFQGIATAILAIATDLQAASGEWSEAEAALQRGLESACDARRDGHKHVRCRVICQEGYVTVIVLDADEYGMGRTPSAQTTFLVYSDSGCTIWLVTALSSC